MRRLILVSLLAAGALAAWVATTRTSAQQPPLASLARQAPQFRNEQEWLVIETIRAIAQQAQAAGRSAAITRISVATRQATAEELIERATLDIVVGEGEPTTLELSPHLWAPGAYAGLARTLFGTKGTQGSRTPTPDGRLVTMLLMPTAERLLEADDLVSAALARNRLDPGAHDDAALLLATMAWRERAGRYSDVRRLLSRITAHRAIAQALHARGVPGESGRLADAMVSLLVGREDLHDAQLAAWPETSRSAAARSWVRALGLRAMGDWRQTTITAESPLLERYEYARALRDRVSISRFLGFYDEQVPRTADDVAHPGAVATDWHRIALAHHFGIEAGHRFTEAAVRRELHEAGVAWRHYHQGTPSDVTLIAALNDAGDGEGRVLGWTTWAPALQRQLAAALASTARFLVYLGASRDHEAWPATVEGRFGGLVLFPFVLRDAAATADVYERAMRAARQTQGLHPEWVPAGVSLLLLERPGFKAPPQPFVDDRPWFTPHVPTGTGYDLEFRTLAPGCPRPVPLRYVERWAAWAPHSTHVLKSLVWLRAPGEPAFADMQRAMAHLVDYDTGASGAMLQQLHGTPEQEIEAARAICRIDPDYCGWLHDRLLSDGREEEAVKVGDAYVSAARDTVGLSHYTGWLVKYLWDTGEKARARAIAGHVGATGSAAGLESAGDLLDREGRFDEAEATYQAILDRYDDATALTAFCLRRAVDTGEEAWTDRAMRVGAAIFPQGLEPGDPAWLPAPPTDGVTLVTCGRRCARSGARAGDVIVAVDGHRVRSLWQYMVLSRGGRDTHMRLAVWRSDRYLTLDPTVPQRWLSVSLADHRGAH